MHRYGHFVNTFKTFQNTQGHLWTLLRLSHGENMGSSPLGSASKINHLDEVLALNGESSPSFLQ
jgi:hypothetical protein